MAITLESRSSAFRSLASAAGALLGTLGGLASIVYVSGFLRSWAYLQTFHATWLVRELPPSAFLVAGLLGLAEVLCCALALNWETPMSVSVLQRVSSGLCALGIALYLPDQAGEMIFTTQARSFFDYGSAICLLIAAGVAARLVVEQSVANNLFGNLRAAGAALMLSLLAFVFAPLILGRGEGLSVYASPSKNLQVATIRVDKTTQNKLVLLIGADRVYCVNVGASETTPDSIVPVKWENVVCITAAHDR